MVFNKLKSTNNSFRRHPNKLKDLQNSFMKRLTNWSSARTRTGGSRQG